MKIILIALMLFLTVSIFAIQQDKILHFLVSAGIYDVTYNILGTTELSNGSCEGIAFWSSLGVGIGKELYDEYSEDGTGFSRDDMFFNLVGIVSSIGFNRLVRKLEYKRLTIMLNKNRINIEKKF